VNVSPTVALAYVMGMSSAASIMKAIFSIRASIFDGSDTFPKLEKVVVKLSP